jgi:phosphatidate cytidylyltransferase
LHFTLHGAAIPADVRETVYGWGGLTVLALFAAIWLCDSAAYFAGTRFGRHKLLERVSPKKTWEGVIAGGIAAVLAFVLARALLLPYMTITTAVVCGLIVGVFGQLGDLVESLIKRDTGVKDSSSLIPGHGGILDRFDSVIFVSPIIYFYLDFIVF